MLKFKKKNDYGFEDNPPEKVKTKKPMSIWLMASLILSLLPAGICMGANPCGIAVSPASGLQTSEYGGTATFTVVLNCEPANGATVTINLSSSDTSEGTVAPSSLTFTAANCATPQTVTVNGVDDTIYDGSQGFQIITSPAVSQDPKYSGVDAADVSVTNTDNDSYTAPEINVQGYGRSITDGNETPSDADYTDFLNADISSGQTDHIFTIENNGNATLRLTGTNPVSITGANSPDFSVITQPAPSVAPGSYTSFTVRFDPSSIGLKSAMINIANDDSDENPYNFSVQGTGTARPLMMIDGVPDNSPINDYTNFGKIPVTDGTIEKSYFIRNVGNGDLHLTGTPVVSITGPNASDFKVLSQPSALIPANGGFSKFTVRFKPSDAGLRTATVTIENDSDNARCYDFDVTGSGKCGIIVSPTSGLRTTSSGDTDSFEVFLDCKPAADVMFGINNNGSLSNIIFTPENWNKPQKVTLSGLINNVQGSYIYKVVTYPAQSEDPKYNGIDPEDVSVTNYDSGIPADGVTIEANGSVIVQPGIPLTNLTNKGTVDGGMLSGTNYNTGIISHATLTGGSTLFNTGGTISDSEIRGRVYGGTVSGTIVNYGVLSGLAPDGSLSYLIVNTGSIVSGGLISGGFVTILGNLNNPTIDAGTSLDFTDGSEAVDLPGGLGGTVSFMIPAQPPTQGQGAQGPPGTGCEVTIPQGTSYPDPTSVPPQGFEVSAVGIPAYAAGHGWNTAGGRASEKDGKSEAFIPEIPGGYALVGGIVLSETGAKSSSAVSVSVPYDKSKIPNGYGDDDIIVLVYDYNDKAWIKAPSSRSGDSAIKFNTDLITAYALVVKLNTPPASDLISVSQISGNTSEDGSVASFTVVLGSAPSSDVILNISSSDQTEGKVSPSSLVFTPSNWNTAQTVSVIGADDYETDGDQAYFVITGASVSNDPSYKGIDPSDVSVVNIDNDKGIFVPTKISPENGALDVPMTPVLSMQEPAISIIESISGFGKHAKTRWQVSRSSDFAPFDLVFSITASTSLYSVTVPYLALTPGSTYFWRARFVDEKGNESDWSHASKFTVVPVNPDDADNDGIADAFKISETTDLDADGTDDANQTDMLRTRTASADVMIGVKKTGSVLSIGSAMAGPEKSAKAGDRPLGVLEIRASLSAPGAEAEVLVHSSTALGKSSGWLAFDASSGWYDYSPNASFSSDGKCVTLKIKDGSYGDSDGCANGVIIHKAALPKTAADEAGSGGSCFIDSVPGNQKGLFLWIMAALPAFLLKSTGRKHKR